MHYYEIFILYVSAHIITTMVHQKLCTFQDFHQASETMTSSFIHIMSLFLMLKSLGRADLYKFAAKPKARGAKDY